MSTSNDWVVRKAAGLLKPGEQFIFADDLGGEGQTVTVVAVSGDMFGTTEIEVKELDATLDFGTSQWVTVTSSTELEEDVPTDTEYTERREKLAEFLVNMVYGDGAWAESDANMRLNYRMDAQDIIKANPHLLSLGERERLQGCIPELAYDPKEEA